MNVDVVGPAGGKPRGAWLGVDVGAQRKGFDLALIDGHRLLELHSGVSRDGVLETIERTQPALVAVDGPRCCAAGGATARDCEREINRRICGIRWTPDAQALQASEYYAWILEGLALFDALRARHISAIEVFPTASWTRWIGPRAGRSRARWSRSGLAALGLHGVPRRTNQDERDAIAAAVTARQHTHGSTETIGEIVVPAPPISR
jgi:predicted nuclease with RNAse H fold